MPLATCITRNRLRPCTLPDDTVIPMRQCNALQRMPIHGDQFERVRCRTDTGELRSNHESSGALQFVRVTHGRSGEYVLNSMMGPFIGGVV